jgi:hypothetical protein
LPILPHFSSFKHFSLFKLLTLGIEFEVEEGLGVGKGGLVLGKGEGLRVRKWGRVKGGKKGKGQ